jgi:hypothetical protein
MQYDYTAHYLKLSANSSIPFEPEIAEQETSAEVELEAAEK